MAPINRITLFKVPSAEARQNLLELYKDVSKTNSKVGYTSLSILSDQDCFCCSIICVYRGSVPRIWHSFRMESHTFSPLPPAKHSQTLEVKASTLPSKQHSAAKRTWSITTPNVKHTRSWKRQRGRRLKQRWWYILKLLPLQEVCETSRCSLSILVPRICESSKCILQRNALNVVDW